MRGRPLVAILGAAAIVVVAGGLAVWLFAGGKTETAATSIVVDIPDNPAALAASEAQEAEVVATLPDEIPAPEEEVAEEPAAPQELLIADTIRQKTSDPALRQGAHPDDLAAIEKFYAQHNGPALWVTSNGLSPEAKSIIGEIAKADEWGLDASTFVYPPADYVPTVAEDQAAAEIALSLAVLSYARAAAGGRVDPGAVSEVFDQQPSLREPGAVLTGIAASTTPDAYLHELHPKHAQFEKLRQALLKAQSEEDIVRLKANMERWRWMPEDLGGYYVWLNIPEFMLYVVKDGKTVRTEKIVVGSPSSPTPVLTADMKSIVFNPERVVPLSVIRRDVLPKLRESGGFFGGGAASILDQYQLTVKNRGRPVDPSNIDWDKVDLSKLTFVQASGPTNILGKVQFLYPNDRDVYMHDTIISSQLEKAVRAEGSAEPRVANPENLAALLLAEDKGWSKARVNQLVGSSNMTEVKIDKPVPVHMTYFTAVVDGEGEVKTFGDVYKLDKPIEGAATDDRAAAPGVADTAPVPPRKPDGSLAATAP